jgi:hypothetical protein
VFLVVLLLLFAVAYVLFSGTAWIFAPVESITGGSSFSAIQSLNAARTPVKPPSTFVAPTAVPPLAGVLIQPTPTPTVPGAQPPSATPSAATTPPAGAPPPVAPPQTPAPPTPGPQTSARVGNTGGDGVYLRHTPRKSDTWIAWRDNTPLVLTGATATGDGLEWVQVRDPNNNVGWVPAQFVVH